MRFLLLLLIALPAYADITTVILVRHAEKASDSHDPPLSEAGVVRAKELARTLGGTKIDAVYSTQYERTKRTAAAVVDDAKVFEGGKSFAKDMAAHIRTTHQGQTVLVVGHSNTTRDVALALGVEDVPKIDESQYDYMFIVTLAGDDEKLVVLRYGASTP